MPESFGRTEAVSMALGGMIGGGIYAVLGVVAQVAGHATWVGFVAAGAIALCAGYSYARLNAAGSERGGAVSFVVEFAGRPSLAGMVGWTLLFGYVGSMAMYAVAFGEFVVGFGTVPASAAGVPLRPVVSVAAVALFVALNVGGARVTGAAENALVAGKVAVLVAFGAWGLAFLGPISGQPTRLGLAGLAPATPVVAAGISFVAFQGWQLLFYDQDSIEDATRTVREAVYVSIPVAVAIYVLVAIVTTNLAPQAIRTHPHVALGDAAAAMLAPVDAGELGTTVISVSALFSTGSAINATLFSSARFAGGLLSRDLLPDQFGEEGSGDPSRLVLVLGGITALLAAWGRLAAITSFASLAFIGVFGGTCALAFREREREGIHPLPPAVGALGSAAFAPVLLWDLFRREPATFWTVLALVVGVAAVELWYFERDVLADRLSR
ncbi:MAG: APC family permease [Halobacteriaceae archaeon]